jgi:transcriptional regulator with XRE-family HTH domain
MTASEFKAARVALGLSQSQLAKRLGWAGAGHVSKVENGRAPVSEPTALHMQTLLRGLKK